MATDHTEHYQLSQWTAEDSFLREEFNEDFRKIDQALSLKCQVVLGSYTGTGTDDQFIALGFTPRAVLVAGSDGMFEYSGFYYGGLAVGPLDPEDSGTATGKLDIETGGFRVHSNSRGLALNSKSKHYYIALR